MNSSKLLHLICFLKCSLLIKAYYITYYLSNSCSQSKSFKRSMYNTIDCLAAAHKVARDRETLSAVEVKYKMEIRQGM